MRADPPAGAKARRESVRSVDGDVEKSETEEGAPPKANRPRSIRRWLPWRSSRCSTTLPATWSRHCCPPKLVSGYVADRIGHLKTLTVLGYGVANVPRPLLGFATTWWQVLAIRFGDRVGKGVRGTPRDALVTLVTPPGVAWVRVRIPSRAREPGRGGWLVYAVIYAGFATCGADLASVAGAGARRLPDGRRRGGAARQCPLWRALSGEVSLTARCRAWPSAARRSACRRPASAGTAASSAATSSRRQRDVEAGQRVGELAAGARAHRRDDRDLLSRRLGPHPGDGELGGLDPAARRPGAPARRRAPGSCRRSRR